MAEEQLLTLEASEELEDEYQDTRALLKSWGLEHLIDVFVANKCTSFELRHMKDSVIERMVQSNVRDQVKFTANRDAWVAKLEECESQEKMHTLYNMDTSQVVQMPSQRVSSYSQQLLSSQKSSSSCSNFPVVETPTTHHAQNDNTDVYASIVRDILGSGASSGASSCLLSTPSTSTPLVSSPSPTTMETLLPSASVSSNASTLFTAGTSEGPSTSGHSVNLTIGSTYLSDLLESSHEGKNLLANGRTNGGRLTPSNRKLLSNIIIRALQSQDPSRPIYSVEFTRLSLQIKHLFPQEAPSVWFSHSLPATAYQKKSNSQGLLYECYITRRRNLRKQGLIPESQRRRSSVSSTSTPRSSSPISLTPETFVVADVEDELQANLKWLQDYSSIGSDWERVIRLWRATHAHRMKCILNGAAKYKDIYSYFDTFKVLRDPTKGFQLLAEDFRCYEKTGKNEDCLFHGLNQIQEKVLEKARQKVKESKNKDIIDSINAILGKLEDDSSNTTKNSAILMLLPSLLKASPNIVLKKGKKKHVPSRKEILDSFITQVHSAADIKTNRSNKIEKYTKIGLSIQPYVLFVGSSFVSPNQVFVVLDSVMYPQSTISDAVDLLFKIFYVTHCSYPVECYDIWMFLQRGIYKIKDTQYDKFNVTWSTLLTDLGFASDV